MKKKIKQHFGYVLKDGKVIGKFDQFNTQAEHQFEDGSVVVDDCTREDWEGVQVYKEPEPIPGEAARLVAADGYFNTVPVGDVVDELLKAIAAGDDIATNPALNALADSQTEVKARYVKGELYIRNDDGTYSPYEADE